MHHNAKLSNLDHNLNTGFMARSMLVWRTIARIFTYHRLDRLDKCSITTALKYYSDQSHILARVQELRGELVDLQEVLLLIDRFPELK